MLDGSGSFDAYACARIGPNAILQLAAPVRTVLGAGTMDAILTAAHVAMPAGDEMIPETHVARVHETLWRMYPDQAREISIRAGKGTAGYIRRHRIPIPARIALRLMPRRLGERMLTRAIVAHAWTFCGSGMLAVKVEGAEVHFTLENNPLAASDVDHPCHWHAAVFAELFSVVLGGAYYCTEVSCRGCGGLRCHFVLRRGRKPGHFKGLAF